LNDGTLFVVATPIGNLDDLSPRARQLLGDVDLIAAEDTRHTGRLLSHFGINTPQIALHEHNEDAAVAGVIEQLRSGLSVALVSDAGTPLVSDPGYRLVRAAHDHGIRVSPVPGPSAVISAMSAAGLPSDRFCFEGYPPGRREARRAALSRLRDEPRTLVFLESVHRIQAFLEDLVSVFGGDRDAFIGRELSKLHEQCVKADLASLAAMLEDGTIVRKGEFVVVVGGSQDVNDDAAVLPVRDLLAELLQHLPGSQAVDIVARISRLGRNEVYRLMLRLRQKEGGE
jgi:16S rRNA (cytidine1402-2'-O)-methyltransferase